jgi:hypothetical protein
MGTHKDRKLGEEEKISNFNKILETKWMEKCN